MKKLIRILMVLLLAGLILPSVYSAGKKEEAVKNSSEKQTLIIYSTDPNNEDYLINLFDEFGKDNNVKFKFISVISDDFMQRFMTATNSNSQIDLILGNGQDVRYLASVGMIKDLNNEVDYLDRFLKTAVAPYVINGKLYGIPYADMTTSGLFYNKILFKEDGLEVPKTYKELVAVTKAFNEKGIAGISFGGASTYMWPMWFFQTFAQTSGNKSMERTIETLKGNAKFTDDDYVAAMAALEKFGKDNIFEFGFNGVDSDGGRALFISGKAAAFYGGVWELQVLRDSGMDNDTLGITFFPIVSKGAEVEQTGGSGNAVSIYSGIAPERMELALKLTDWFTSDEISKRYAEQIQASLSVNKNVDLVSDPLTSFIANEILPHTVTFLDWMWPPEITSAFQEQIQAITGGQTTSVEAMKKIQKVFDGLVADGYKFND